jgi:hypothetical protein
MDPDTIGGLGCFVAIVAIFAALVVSSNQKAKRTSLARQAYLESLKALKRRPADPDLRQSTLELGRVYSNLTRDSKGVTVFDEVALSNDINAACAAAARPDLTPAATHVPQPIPSASLEDRLNRLKALLATGVITDDEYRERRAKLLDEV